MEDHQKTAKAMLDAAIDAKDLWTHDETGHERIYLGENITAELMESLEKILPDGFWIDGGQCPGEFILCRPAKDDWSIEADNSIAGMIDEFAADYVTACEKYTAAEANATKTVELWLSSTAPQVSRAADLVAERDRTIDNVMADFAQFFASAKASITEMKRRERAMRTARHLFDAAQDIANLTPSVFKSNAVEWITFVIASLPAYGYDDDGNEIPMSRSGARIGIDTIDNADGFSFSSFDAPIWNRNWDWAREAITIFWETVDEYLTDSPYAIEHDENGGTSVFLANVTGE